MRSIAKDHCHERCGQIIRTAVFRGRITSIQLLQWN